MPSLLQVTDACVRLGSKMFGPFTLGVAAGERIAILGPSGAGKSTLMKLMARELTPAQGHVFLQGRNLRDWRLPALSRLRAVLPQSHDVAFGLPVDLVIALGRVALAHDPALPHIVRQAAGLARADHLLARRFDTLSGGEKARVHLARVFAQLWDVEQGLVMVDEPLAALDPGLQFQLMDAMLHFAAERGHAVIAILHDVNQALRDFERLLLIEDGALVGDMASDIASLPKLEALYGVRFASAVGTDGEVITAAVRGASCASAAIKPATTALAA
ncbi:ATP-binding cassette domain-containing protein [Ottowia testudinis]|uniref:ATP-binding cassette domain-containing protein n=2 Tax=Ottowia testudinis TaxID=2816950 RepID=A0A975CJ45_9BURK|nr:ATP-binding cassette domain-containing protein [Ottowia testudinis]